MNTKNYNRLAAVQYAKKWALSRNPKYYAFDKIGGNCTNFISQCIYAGSSVMNYTPTYGWYYINSTQRSPSWTGVNYLYNFLTSNSGVGPFAVDVLPSKLQLGDVIQLGNETEFYHSLLVVYIEKAPSFYREETFLSNIYVAAHDFNAYMRPVMSYSFQRIRSMHIEGVRYN